MNTGINHHLLTDLSFEQQFENCTLYPDIFSHEAHIRLAWIHVTKYGSEQAAINLCEQIQKFDKTFGSGKKYNAALTIASVLVINDFIQKSSSNDFFDFINEFPELKNNFKELVLKKQDLGNLPL